MRNNSGAFINPKGIPVRFGLGNVSKKVNEAVKTSDYIGFTEVTITESMVGKTLPVFTALEIKEKDWKYTGTPREVAQKKFIDIVLNKNGIAAFVNSIESFKEDVLNKFFGKS